VASGNKIFSMERLLWAMTLYDAAAAPM
jgi:hypothetical protein